MRRRRHVLLAAVAALLLSTVVAAIGQVPPSLTLNPTHGLVGSSVTATGAGFSPAGTATLYMDEAVAANQLTTATISDSGAFSKSFVVPNKSVGSHTVIACKGGRAGACVEQATATFTINAPPATTTTTATTTPTPGGTTTSPPRATTTTHKGITNPTTTNPGDPPAPSSTFPLGVATTTTQLGLAGNTDQPDIEVGAVEMTQGVQNLKNSMPLVADRRTWARVYPESDNGPLFEWPNIDGAMQLKTGNKTTVIYPENGPISTHGSVDRTNLDHTLNFIIPKAHTAEGNTTFRVLVWAVSPSSIKNETNPDNNDKSLSLHFWKGENPFLYVAALDPSANPGDEPSPTVMSTVQEWMGDGLLDLHPIANPGFLVFEDAVVPGDEAEVKGIWDLSVRRTEPLERLQWLHLLLGFSDDMRMAGVFNETLDGGGYSGWSIPSTFSFWTMKSTRAVAHELGHDRGLGHVGCKDTKPVDGIPDEVIGGGLDTSYPFAFPNCRFAPLDKRGFYGFTTYRDKPYVYSNDPTSPNAGWPQMSYMSPGWSDPYHYCKLELAYGVPCNAKAMGIGGIGSGFGPKADCKPKNDGGIKLQLCVGTPAQPEYLVPEDPINVLQISGGLDMVHGTGTIKQTAVGDFSQPLSGAKKGKLKYPNLVLKSASTSQYAIALFDANDKVLARVPVRTEGSGHGNQQNADLEHSGYFETVPMTQGVKKMKLEGPGHKELAARTASANSPKVAITAPTAGASVGREFTISWSATDADGDALTSHVQWTRDNGATWQAVGTGLTGTSVNVTDKLALPGGKVRVRVWVSDGFNTASATSKPFNVAEAKPHMTISGPGATVPRYALTRLGASPFDPEDGRLTNVVWSSSVDGPIGRGTVLETRSLSLGDHVVTATASDKDGNKVSGTTSFTVIDDGRTAPRVAGAVPEAERLLAQNASATKDDDVDDDDSNNELLYGGVAAVAVAIAAAGGSVWRRRRRSRVEA